MSQIFYLYSLIGEEKMSQRLFWIGILLVAMTLITANCTSAQPAAPAQEQPAAEEPAAEAPAATEEPAVEAPAATEEPAAEVPAATEELVAEAPATEVPASTEAPAESSELKAITVQSGANDPRSIDPQRAIDTRDWRLLAQLFPSLTVLNLETQETMPGMAESWEVSEDGLVYTFHLLDEVPWVRYNSDTGAVEQVVDENDQTRYVTAHDFVYGYLRALDPETGSPAAYMLAPYVAGAAEFNGGTGSREEVEIKAVDDYTFEVTTPEKVGFTLAIYSIINARATPARAIEESGDAWTEPESINTYGPFALKEWAHESHMTFVKNPFWPGSEGISQPALDEITFRFVDEAVGLREYEAGTFDVTEVPPDQITRVQVDATLGSELKIVPGTCSQVWGFNTTKAPFDNVHIRRAFNYAVDRETLVKDVLAGGQVPAPFFTPPSIGMAPAGTDIGDLGIRFDLDKAKEELELGLKDLGLSSVEELPSITVEFGTEQELSAVAQALQAMWQETLGIQVELSQIDNTVYWSKQEEDAGQIFRAGWCPDYNDANNYLRDVYRSDSIYNYGKWSNPKYDELVDQARVETDPAKRVELYTEAEQLMCVEDAGIMALYYPVEAQLTKPNIERTFASSTVENFWEWDIVE
jgi:oligopeptide transport system substrate-binding protein